MKWIVLFVNLGCFLLAMYGMVSFWPSEHMTYKSYLFPLFLGIFGLVFLITSLYIYYNREIIKNKVSLYILNITIIVLFGLTYFTAGNIMENTKITDPQQVPSIIYKIDAAGYNKIRTVHYMYNYKKMTYKDHLLDAEENYNIGDTLLLKISETQPIRNKIIGSIKPQSTSEKRRLKRN